MNFRCCWSFLMLIQWMIKLNHKQLVFYLRTIVHPDYSKCGIICFTSRYVVCNIILQILLCMSYDLGLRIFFFLAIGFICIGCFFIMSLSRSFFTNLLSIYFWWGKRKLDKVTSNTNSQFSGNCRQCLSVLQAVVDVAAYIKAGFYDIGKIEFQMPLV